MWNESFWLSSHFSWLPRLTYNNDHNTPLTKFSLSHDTLPDCTCIISITHTHAKHVVLWRIWRDLRLSRTRLSWTCCFSRKKIPRSTSRSSECIMTSGECEWRRIWGFHSKSALLNLLPVNCRCRCHYTSMTAPYCIRSHLFTYAVYALNVTIPI